MTGTRCVAAIELGGTKVLAAVGSGPHDMTRSPMFPTAGYPAAVLQAAAGWIRDEARRHDVHAIGVASFGPIDLDPRSPRYGVVGATVKPGWSNASVLDPIRQAFPGLPIGLDTDVNAAVRAERRWGHGIGLSDLVYITVGTGIGGGVISQARVLRGAGHTEIGHLRIARVAGDEFRGNCPFHGDCWEGLCSGSALARRAGRPAEHLSADWTGWPLFADYTAQALANLAYVLAPSRMILGGSVMRAGRLGADALLRMIRDRMSVALSGYAIPRAMADGALTFIVGPRLGDDAGLCGAIDVANEALVARLEEPS